MTLIFNGVITMFKAFISIMQWAGILFIVLIFFLIVLAGAKIQKRRKRDKKEIDAIYD